MFFRILKKSTLKRLGAIFTSNAFTIKFYNYLCTNLFTIKNSVQFQYLNEFIFERFGDMYLPIYYINKKKTFLEDLFSSGGEYRYKAFF